MSKVEEIRAKLAKEKEARVGKLYDNEKFATTVAMRINREENISRLKELYEQLTAIPSVRLPRIGEVKINMIEAEPALFGKELSMLLGLVTSLSMIFLEEQSDIAYDLVGTSNAEIEDLITSLGRPSYLDKRNMVKVDAIAGDYEIAVAQLEVFADNVGLHAPDLSRFTEAMYNMWFTRAENRVNTKLEEMRKEEAVAEELSKTTLTIED